MQKYYLLRDNYFFLGIYTEAAKFSSWDCFKKTQ